MLYALVDTVLEGVHCYVVNRLNTEGEGDEVFIGWIIYDENTCWGWKYITDPATDLFRFKDPVYHDQEQAIQELEDNVSS